jgi:hypothetical protein
VKTSAGLTVEQLAKVLGAASRGGVTAAMIEADVDAGAPINEDGTINLFFYAAWLIANRENAG